MVGPTGSGKSTTLYSMLNALNTTDRKLITLEDPIEYGLSGMSQIPIDTTHGQSFADGLRSVLRLDPDVVMVGEIRDVDTARTAIQASITGHLVLSSFHANTTSTAFSRMIDMIGGNPIFSSAIRLLIAQRLVRRLVDHTKEAYEPDEATRKYVQRVLEKLPHDVEKPDLDNFKLWRPVPSEDAPFGYKGRVVIMEQLVVTDEIQKFIRGDVQDVHPETIEETARNEGMLTLEQVGVLAALRGGIKHVLIPQGNVKDLEEIPDNVKEGLTIHPVKWIDEVLALGLEYQPETAENADNGQVGGSKPKSSAKVRKH